MNEELGVGKLTLTLPGASEYVKSEKVILVPDTLNNITATRLDQGIVQLDQTIETIKTEVSTGKNIVAAAIAENGVPTVGTDTFANIAVHVKTMATNKYNEGVSFADGRINTSSASYTKGKTDGISEADGRVNTSSASYSRGHNDGISAADARVNKSSASYNSGVNDADARVNTSSASYTSGYNNGNTAGYNRGVTEADNRVNVNSVNYQNGYNAGKAAGGELKVFNCDKSSPSINLGRIFIIDGGLVGEIANYFDIQSVCEKGDDGIYRQKSIALRTSSSSEIKYLYYSAHSSQLGFKINLDNTVSVGGAGTKISIVYFSYSGEYID